MASVIGFVEKVKKRSASANDIRGGFAGKWVIRLASANDIRVGTAGND